MKAKKLWERGLSILLIFQILVAGSLGIFMLVNFPGILEQFGIKHQPDMGILQFIMVYNACVSLSICVWSVIWIRRGNIAGIQTGTTVGLLIFLVSMAVFIRFDRVDMLLFDSLRAFLMVVFGILAYREHKKQPVAVS